MLASALIINIVSIVILFLIFLVCTLLLVFKKYLRSEYEFVFYADDVLKVEKVAGGTNYLFDGPQETKKYINEYVLSNIKRKKYFICEYGENVNSIQYFILAYSGNKKIVNIIRVKERRPKKFSKMIKIPKKTKGINIVVTKVNGFDVDLHPIKKIKVFRIFRYSFWMSLGLFSFVNAARLLIVVILGRYYLEAYLKEYGNIQYIITGLVSFVLFIALFIILLIKNRYFARSRGGFYGKY